ncbi:YggT family protein [Candidatus Gracilibacteria bacterium]|nr:YggT family protein [Candidatus Gracilibacteria bacterium]MCF7856203.1 YggT family protein [Candidatus Gracilibacteria bacterium]MCF7896475.1 YggT family protein [Candidatus Gracilibacteria bacterium]
MNFNPDVIAILANTVDIFLRALGFLILMRILLSWLGPRSQGGIVNFVISTTEPILAIFRKLPLRLGMIDFSALVALISIDLLRGFLLKIIFSFL